MILARLCDPFEIQLQFDYMQTNHKKLLLNPLFLFLVFVFLGFLGKKLIHFNNSLISNAERFDLPFIAHLPFNLPPASDEQKSKLDRINEKYAPLVVELQQKIRKTIPMAQRRRGFRARELAVSKRKTDKEIKAAEDKAVSATPEQLQIIKSSQLELSRTLELMKSEIALLLTEDQKKEIKNIEQNSKPFILESHQ